MYSAMCMCVCNVCNTMCADNMMCSVYVQYNYSQICTITNKTDCQCNRVWEQKINFKIDYLSIIVHIAV